MSSDFFILVLGGTPEAHDLTAKLRSEFKCLYSLSGVAAPRRPPPAPHRVGGFGGPEGLIAFLRDEGVTHLVDGTHPFATTMSRNARMACQVLDIPRMIFQRPAWRPQEGDRWYPVPDMAEARVRLPGIGHAPFLALGRGEAATLVDLPDQTPTLRLLPGNPPLAGCRIVEGRGPFTRAGELALLRALGVDCVVRKNSGGRSGYALLEAARILELPVLMVERPIGESGPVTDDPRTVARWIRDPTANTNP